MTRSRTVEISALVHKDMPLCCREAVLSFAALDRYRGGGEPGDEINCPMCGNTLVYAPGRKVIGWRVEEKT